MVHDAIVIGGSFAGLSAATYLARARRSVCVIDAGAPRNRFAAHSHGFLTQDGSNPLAMLATARKQVGAYPGVQFVDGKAVKASGAKGDFGVALETGETLEARRLVLAFGVFDELPQIPGLAERWGGSVIHCPYCHGYEFSDQQLGVLVTSPLSLHQALLVAEWGPVTAYLNGQAGPAGDEALELDRRGIKVEPLPVAALLGTGNALSAIELADGRRQPIDALYVGPRMRLGCDIAHQLGCAMDEMPAGSFIRTDAMKETTVPGVYAAGDIARGAHSVTWASSDGVMAGVATHRSLVF